MAVLRIEDLYSHYGNNLALENINLHVDEREILVIMGHSGSGKSTLFRNILGLTAPTSGNIEVLGKNIIGLGKKRRLPGRRPVQFIKCRG